MDTPAVNTSPAKSSAVNTSVESITWTGSTTGLNKKGHPKLTASLCRNTGRFFGQQILNGPAKAREQIDPIYVLLQQNEKLKKTSVSETPATQVVEVDSKALSRQDQSIAKYYERMNTIGGQRFSSLVKDSFYTRGPFQR